MQKIKKSILLVQEMDGEIRIIPESFKRPTQTILQSKEYEVNKFESVEEVKAAIELLQLDKETIVDGINSQLFLKSYKQAKKEIQLENGIVWTIDSKSAPVVPES